MSKLVEIHVEILVEILVENHVEIHVEMLVEIHEVWWVWHKYEDIISTLAGDASSNNNYITFSHIYSGEKQNKKLELHGSLSCHY